MVGDIRSRWFDRVGIAVLCVAHFLVVCDASSKSTPTIDEFAHLPAGITYLRTGSFRYYPHNPPLPRLVAGLAAETQTLRVSDIALALEQQARPVPGSPQLNLPNYLLLAELVELENTTTREATQRYFAAFAWGRRAIAAWSALTIPVLFAWAAWSGGRAAGWTAAGLWACCPTVIGHAGLVTTDVPAASLSVVAAWAFACWLHQPGWTRALPAGLALGAALLTKFSVVLLLPVFLAWLMIQVARNEGLSALKQAGLLGPFRAPLGRQFLSMLAIALFVLNAGYLFEGTGTPLDNFEFASQTLTRARRPGDPPCVDETVQHLAPQRINRFEGSLLGMLPSPVPAMYLVGFDRLKWEAEGKYDLYLRGQWQRKGYWDYYLYGLAVKEPLGTGLLLVLAVANLAWRLATRRPPVPFVGVWLVLTALPLVVLSVLQDVNLGLRYALPAFPFLFLFLAVSSAAAAGAPRGLQCLAVLSVLFNAGSVFRVHPHELSYFNEAAGGVEHGRFHLIDSNLDWGQDLTRLAEWVRRNPECSDVRLAYWGAVRPELVGFAKHRLAPRDVRQLPRAMWLPAERDGDWGPQPGKFAVSVNFERGMGFRTPLPSALAESLPLDFPGRHGVTLLSEPPDAFAWFRQLTPRIEPEIGYSLLLYDVSAEEARRIRRVLGLD